MPEEKELIVYAGAGIAIGKTLYDKIDEVRKKLLYKGTNSLPFKAKLDFRKGGRRFVIHIAIQCLDYLLNKGE